MMSADNAERIFRDGYRARSIDDCPYPEATRGAFVFWMNGWRQHQRDRERLAELAARRGCHTPLTVGVER